MTTDIQSILKSQLTNGSWGRDLPKQIPLEQVDELADELTSEYFNPNFRQWYCGVIYQFGVAQVTEWRRRASEGREPAKLFSKYVKDARSNRGSGGHSNV